MKDCCCGKCNHKWLPRTPKPQKCPKCGTYQWKGGKNVQSRYRKEGA